MSVPGSKRQLSFLRSLTLALSTLSPLFQRKLAEFCWGYLICDGRLAALPAL